MVRSRNLCSNSSIYSMISFLLIVYLQNEAFYNTYDKPTRMKYLLRGDDVT